MRNIKLIDEWKWRNIHHNDLRFPFHDSNNLIENFSQAWQDIFVLSMLDGKRFGKYLEIGANHPLGNNNSAILSAIYEWEGVSIDYDPSFLSSWMNHRENDALVITDAIQIDYEKAIPIWFGENSYRIDYLQLDIDPSFNTLKVLKKLPLEKYRFSVITFETDAYSGDLRARDESREILKSHGYELIAKDICVLYTPISNQPIPFEDWWIDPEVISSNKLKELKTLNSLPKLPQEIIFKN